MPAMKTAVKKAYDKATKQDIGVSIDTQINLLRAYLQSPVYEKILAPLHQKIREALIERGITSRSQEDKIQMWAALEACDLILDTPHVKLRQLEANRGYSPINPHADLGDI